MRQADQFFTKVKTLPMPIDMRDLGVSEDDSQNIWFTDPTFKALLGLAQGLGVSKVIFAERAEWKDSVQGSYFGVASPEAVPSTELKRSQSPNGLKWNLSGWLLSSKEKNILYPILRKGRIVIIVNVWAETENACEILSHEIGHHVVHHFAGFRPHFLKAAPTNAARLDSRFDEYGGTKNNDEFFAESFRFYLGGEPMGRIDLRGILNRVRKNDSRAFDLLRNYRKRAVRAAHINARSLKLNRNTSLAA
jgi:hypothetical protein